MYSHAVILTFYLWVFLLSPLGNKHCNFAMSSAPEVLHSQSDASTGEKHPQAMTGVNYNIESLLMNIPSIIKYNSASVPVKSRRKALYTLHQRVCCY